MHAGYVRKATQEAFEATVYWLLLKSGGQAARQHGFRPDCSTICALREVTEVAMVTQRGGHCSFPVLPPCDFGR